MSGPGGNCAWCGGPAARWATVAPAKVGVVRGRKVVKHPALEQRCCETCWELFKRDPVSLQREVARQRAARWGSQQDTLF